MLDHLLYEGRELLRLIGEYSYYFLFEGRMAVKSAYDWYAGDGVYLILFYIAIIYIFCRNNKFAKNTMVYPIMFIFVGFVINPIVAEFVLVGLESSTYYRNYWLLVDIVVISYVAVCVVFSLENKVKRAIVTIGICVVLIFAGQYMFVDDDGFNEAETILKLPSETIHLAHTMEPLNITRDERVLADFLVASEIRMYDAGITLVYGYSLPVDGYVVYEHADYIENAQLLYDMIYEHTIAFDEEAFYKALISTQCKYMIVYNQSEVMPFLNEVDWLSEVAATDVHVILKVGDTDKFQK